MEENEKRMGHRKTQREREREKERGGERLLALIRSEEFDRSIQELTCDIEAAVLLGVRQSSAWNGPIGGAVHTMGA
jgi:hypothetical protein